MNRLVHPNIENEKILYGLGFENVFHIKQHHKLTQGHIGYGIHKLIPRSCQYITFLRYPVDRAISHYYFIRQCDPSLCLHSRHEVVQSHTLAEYYQLQRYRNETTKMIAGIELERLHRYLDSALLDKVILARAKYNLQHNYKCFGLQNRFEDSIRLFKSQFGWRRENSLDKRHKKTHERPRVEDIDSTTRSIVEDAHQLDLEPYRFAQRLFDERMKLLETQVSHS